jgi:hypothetical protein
MEVITPEKNGLILFSEERFSFESVQTALADGPARKPGSAFWSIKVQMVTESHHRDSP